VKAFIAEANQYDNLEVKYVGGDPRFVFYDADSHQVGDEEVVITKKKDELHDFLKQKGFLRKVPA